MDERPADLQNTVGTSAAEPGGATESRSRHENGDKAGGNDGNSAALITAALAGAVALIQAVFAALATANGGLAAAALNEQLLVFIGFLGVVIGLLVAAAAFVIPNDDGANQAQNMKFGRNLRPFLLLASAFAVLAGITTTAIAALIAPVKQSQPSISASLSPGSPPVLHASITATGISRGVTYDIFIFGESLKYVVDVPPDHPYLYWTTVGADSKGNVNVSVSIPIPSRTYPIIGIHAFPSNGTSAGCYKRQSSATFNPIEGCAFFLVSDLVTQPVAR